MKLKTVQSWMQQFIVDPGSDAQAEVAAGRAAGLPSQAAALLFRPSATLDPFERAMIYGGQYLMRMTEAMAADYPGVQAFLGDERFEALVAEYVQPYPSRSYSLNRLGGDFPAFVETCEGLPRRALLHDLARLELAMCQVFDEEETAPLAAEAIAARSADSWNDARLIPIAALRIVELDYPVSGFLFDLLKSYPEPEDGHWRSPIRPPLRKRPSWVAVYRRNYEMYRLDLTRAAYLLLRELVAERPLALALDAALSSSRGINADSLFRWFSRWVSEGLFQAIR